MRLDGLEGGIGAIGGTDRAREDGNEARGGDARGHGLEALFREQAPRLMRLLKRNTFGREDALDIVQEGFLRMVSMVERRAAPLNPEAYLQRIVRNLMHDHARRAAKLPQGSGQPIDVEALGDRGPGPEEALHALDLLRRYEAALAGLSPKTREVFLRHRRDGFSYIEIASQLNQSVSNVEKHMMKAIAHLDRALGDSV